MKLFTAQQSASQGFHLLKSAFEKKVQPSAKQSIKKLHFIERSLSVVFRTGYLFF